MSSNPLVDAASGIILRGFELEKQNKLTESFVCYQEGIGILIKALKLLSTASGSFSQFPNNSKFTLDSGLRNRLRQKVNEYMDKAEHIKELIKKETASKSVLMALSMLEGNYHEQMIIDEGSTGYGYQRIFGRFLNDGTVQEVWVDDPYIRSSFQIENFSHFCEILVQSQSPVRKLHLVTGKDTQQTKEQSEKFTILKLDLAKHRISFDWSFSDTLHDREIRFDNGWIIKIGRGLDYIRRSEHKFFGLGVHDYDFRPCAATTIDIFHRSSLHVDKNTK
ncbi:uncharacterized protein DEA37_0002200 [Paragonimus westermani]|uniref:MIT domain-containing protein 1 n=1 Tax=Paragonimus westermani TaxID=34504 RepID=A0A5J4P382_9TREM|nr:uncharacterized protein DEA37_0002200 [Paragonimus westermani]